MKRNLILSLIIILCLIKFSACDKDDNNGNNIINGEGEVVSDTIILPGFTSVKNIGTAKILISRGNPRQVILKAQQNILDVITCEVSNGELITGFLENVSVSSSKEIEIEITIPEISEIASIGAGSFYLEGEKQERLNIDIVGVGNVDAYNQEVDTCYIYITGTGNCKVRVNHLLNVTITGVGNVYYKGAPVISSIISGTGQIIDDN